MRNGTFRLLSALTLVVAGPVTAAGAAEKDLPAFPGAEGFGAASIGGRGGRVIKVTNLNAKGPGSLQSALSAKGPRTVVFEVGGVIRPTRGKNPAAYIGPGRVTIAGQTAPPPGITISGMLRTGVDFRAPDVGFNLPGLDGCALSDVTIRFLRVRPGEAGGGGGDCLQFARVNRLIVDHVSTSWASDESVDINGCKNYTVQWCAIEASDTARSKTSDPWARRVGKGPRWNPSGTGPHNFGMILGYGRRDATVHHTLFAHHNRRTPLCGMEVLDHRNNVIYDVFVTLLWHPSYFNRTNPGQPFRANVVANYFKDGPSCPPLYPANYCKGAIAYAEGNQFVGGRYAEGKGAIRPRRPAAMPFAAPPVSTHTAEDAYKLVLAHAGCLPRDAVSRRNIEETRQGAGSWGRFSPQGGLTAGSTPGKAPRDSDDDGMPDTWETAHNLDPNDASDANGIVPAGASANDRHKGYTWIEFYINELADRRIVQAITAAGVANIRPDPSWSPDPKDRPDVAKVAAMLKAADRRQRRIAAEALAAADPDKAIPILTQALTAEQDETRLCAAWALGRFGPRATAAVDALTALLAGRSVPPSPKDASDYARQQIEARRDRDRQGAADALARIGAPALPALVKALADADPETRIAAADALRQMGRTARAAVGLLKRRFTDQNQWVRASAALAVFRIAPETDGLVAALVGGFGEDPGKGIWKDRHKRGVTLPYRLAWALGYLGPKARAALPKLEEVAAWKYGVHKISRPVQRVARWAIGRIKGKIPVGDSDRDNPDAPGIAPAW